MFVRFNIAFGREKVFLCVVFFFPLIFLTIFFISKNRFLIFIFLGKIYILTHVVNN